MNARNRWTEGISLFAVGIAVGATLGMLFAPRSGEETRDYISDTARTTVDQALAQGQRFAKRAQRAASHAREQMREQIDAATDAGERAYDEAARRV
jgi:gas vesicle protein